MLLFRPFSNVFRGLGLSAVPVCDKNMAPTGVAGKLLFLGWKIQFYLKRSI
jgi:hypothetical protein